MTAGSSFSTSQMMGINALRCMFSSGFVNAWYILGALYYAAAQFGYQSTVQSYVNQYYPYVCTCTNDANNLSQLFGNSNTSQQTILSYCSEAASKAVSKWSQWAQKLWEFLYNKHVHFSVCLFFDLRHLNQLNKKNKCFWILIILFYELFIYKCYLMTQSYKTTNTNLIIYFIQSLFLFESIFQFYWFYSLFNNNLCYPL